MKSAATESKPTKTKFIVNERFSGTKKPQDVFSDIVISEMSKKQGKCWTIDERNVIINSPTDSESCCSGKE